MLQTFVNIILDGGFMQERIVLHVDVNNAFLSWTAVDMLNNGSKIDIRNICSVIGGDESQRRGIVLAKSYPAKENGVVTAETLYSARRKCPNLAVYSPDYKLYSKYSNMLYKYLSNYSPLIERYSIDECFLDYTESQKLFGDPYQLACKIKEDIKKYLGFTVNVGIGNNKLCAKMASDFEKPDKVHTLYQDEIKEKMWPLSVDDLFMVGKQTATKLHALNINTIAELAKTDLEFLKIHFKSFALTLWNFANGIDNSLVEPVKPEQKSISMTTVLPYDYEDKDKLLFVIKKLSIAVGMKLRKQNKYANTIILGFKYKDFSKISKQAKCNSSINSDHAIYEEVKLIFNKLWRGEKIRSITVGVSDLDNVCKVQLSLFENQYKIKDEENSLQKVIDLINQKYGANKIMYGQISSKNE